MAMIFLCPGTHYECCSIRVHSNKGIGLSDVVRQTLMDVNSINTPKVLCLLLAVNEHCINTSINKKLQSSESSVQKPPTGLIFRLPSIVFRVSSTK